MMRRWMFTHMVLLLLLGGCTLMQPKGNELASELDRLLAEKHYGKALDMLSRVSPSSPDYARFAEKRKHVEGLAAQYERKTVDDARHLITQNRWAQALNLYDEALERLPRSTALRDGLADLHKQQKARLDAQRLELLIAKGEWLLNTITAYRQMSIIDPRNSDHTAQLNKYVNEGEETAESLIKSGIQAQESGNDELASRAIPLAARLSEKPKVQQHAKKYDLTRDKRVHDNRTLQDKRWRDLAVREQERIEAIQQLTSDYNNFMKQKDFLAARTTLGRLRTIAPEMVNEKGYEKDLSEKIEAESNRLYNEGVMLYGRSQFEKARDSWKKTLELTPSHAKARESLDRVEKVLDRINQLRNKQKN